MKLLKVDTLKEVKKKMEMHFSEIKPKYEEVPLHDSIGRVLGEDLTAQINAPDFNRSVVDGYGIHAEDSFGASESMPIISNVMGSIEMGESAHMVIKKGESVYIPTGGMIPQGVDAMVMIEYVEILDDNSIAIQKSVAPGDGIMAEGDDFKIGTLLLKNGHKVRTQDIGAMAAIGKSKVKVYKKPLISIISTGDELVDIQREPNLGQVRDINSHAIGALAVAAGADVHSIFIASDNFELCKTKVMEALIKSDIVLISGGSSAGSKDMTVDIINASGKPGVFVHGIAIKPGKPTIVAKINDKAVFGLPGHPLSAIIVFKAVVEDFIQKYYLKHSDDEDTLMAFLDSNVHASEGRETYQMVNLIKGAQGYIAIPLYSKSGAVSILLKADGYFRIPVGKEGALKGELVEVVLLN